jgi:hypothetical protein
MHPRRGGSAPNQTQNRKINQMNSDNNPPKQKVLILARRREEVAGKLFRDLLTENVRTGFNNVSNDQFHDMIEEMAWFTQWHREHHITTIDAAAVYARTMQGTRQYCEIFVMSDPGVTLTGEVIDRLVRLQMSRLEKRMAEGGNGISIKKSETDDSIMAEVDMSAEPLGPEDDGTSQPASQPSGGRDTASGYYRN